MKKEFPTEVILSLLTGVLLCEFSQMHEAAEYLMGGSVWTHQFAHRPFTQRIQDAIRAQHPELTDVDASGVDTSNWEAFRARCIKRFGRQLSLTPMEDTERIRGESFIEPLHRVGALTRQEPT